MFKVVTIVALCSFSNIGYGGVDIPFDEFRNAAKHNNAGLLDAGHRSFTDRVKQAKTESEYKELLLELIEDAEICIEENDAAAVAKIKVRAYRFEQFSKNWIAGDLDKIAYEFAKSLRDWGINHKPDRD